MREKSPRLIVTFHTTAGAIATEQLCRRLGLEGKLISVPRCITSDCGMAMAGWGSILLGGCPLRQLILAGEGNGDSAVTVLGMIVGAAVSHNFGLAGAADSVAEDGTYVVGGIGTAGMAAVAIGFAVLLAITVTHLPKTEAVSRD